MKKNLRLIFGMLFVATVFGCAPAMQPSLEPMESTTRTVGKDYKAKVDAFEVVIDASYSMDEDGKNDFLVARDFVRRMNQNIPTDLTLAGALRSIGHDSYQSEKMTDLLYGMTSYQKLPFHQGLGKIQYIGGSTPMAEALQAAGTDFQKTTGPAALILVSDGLDMESAPQAAKALKEKMGDRLCIYTVAVGKERNGAGRKMMTKLAEIGQCGIATATENLTKTAAMTAFVDEVFVAKGTPKAVVEKKVDYDSDLDGVIDAKDKCPGTPAGVTVDSKGCPIDSDKDGVADYLDKCPGTPAGVKVDVNGCPAAMSLHINFNYDSSEVAPQYDGEIAKAAQCIAEYPGNVVFIDGHTDSRGSDAYNQTLSEKRATAVKQRLIERFKVPAARMQARGFGESQPVASNETDEGRAANRRVDVACGAK